MSNYKITKNDTRKLLGIVPALIRWLGMHCPNVGLSLALHAKQDFIHPTHDCRKATKVILKQKHLEQSSIASLRQLFSLFEEETMFHLLYLILTNNKSPLITSHCYRGLVDNLEKMSTFCYDDSACIRLADEEEEEFLEDIWAALGRLPITNFYALQEFCGLIRSTLMDNRKLCEYLAPKVLLPNEEGSFGIRCKGDKVEEAIQIGYFLVKHYHIIFFKSSTSDVPYGGFRKDVIENDKAVVRDLMRARHLETFYAQVDPDYMCIANRLFSFYEFPVIAEAIWKQYKFLPQNWIQDLKGCTESHKDDCETMQTLEWFEKNEHRLVEFKQQGLGIVVVPEKSFRRASRGEKIDLVVQELFCGENVYYERLRVMRDEFVMKILSKASTPKEEKKIGLTKSQIKRVFGERVDRVLNASRRFLIRLESLRLIRSNVKPGRDGQQRTRASLLAEIFISFASQFRKAYTAYTKTHSKCSAILNEATLAVSHTNEMAFQKLFSKVIQEHGDVLNGQSLETLLMAPCKRFVDYKLMFDRMLKTVKKLHGTYSGEIERLDQAFRLCDVLASELNVKIKSAKVVDRVLGDTHKDLAMDYH